MKNILDNEYKTRIIGVVDKLILRKETATMKKDYLHLDDAVQAGIKETAEGINDFIRLGWDREEAIADARRRSCWGVKSWAQVLSLIND